MKTYLVADQPFIAAGEFSFSWGFAFFCWCVMPQADKSMLLEAVRSRKSRSGIVTADRYFRDVQGCFDGGVCPPHVSGYSAEEWDAKLKEAESILTYTNPEMTIVDKSFAKSTGSALLEFNAIVTTPFRDRDGDVLKTKGASVDKNMSLLMYHNPMMTVGPLVKVIQHTDKLLEGRFAIADTVLGRDAAKLVELKALRISHGFDPELYEPMEDEKGWVFHKFSIFEVSLVSIPSNVQAVITAVAEKHFESDFGKQWQQSVIKQAGSSPIVLKSECTCGKQKELFENSEPAVLTLEDDEYPEWVVELAKSCSLHDLPEEDSARVHKWFKDAMKAKGYKFGDSQPCLDTKFWEFRYLDWLAKNPDKKGLSPEWENNVVITTGDGTFVSTESHNRIIRHYNDGLEEWRKEALAYESLSETICKFLKAGSRISATTRSELSEAMQDIQAISETGDLPRGVLALANSAISCIQGLLGSEDEEKSFSEIEKTYFAELVKSDFEKLNSAHRRLSLMLSASKEKQEAREWDDVLSLFT